MMVRNPHPGEDLIFKLQVFDGPIAKQGTGWRTAACAPSVYLPIQNFEKITPSRSSALN